MKTEKEKEEIAEIKAIIDRFYDRESEKTREERVSKKKKRIKEIYDSFS